MMPDASPTKVCKSNVSAAEADIFRTELLNKSAHLKKTHVFPYTIIPVHPAFCKQLSPADEKKRPVAAPTSEQLYNLKFLSARCPDFYAISYKEKSGQQPLPLPNSFTILSFSVLAVRIFTQFPTKKKSGQQPLPLPKCQSIGSAAAPDARIFAQFPDYTKGRRKRNCAFPACGGRVYSVLGIR